MLFTDGKGARNLTCGLIWQISLQPLVPMLHCHGCVPYKVYMSFTIVLKRLKRLNRRGSIPPAAVELFEA